MKNILVHLKNNLPAVKDDVDAMITAGKNKTTLVAYLNDNIDKPSTIDFLKQAKSKLTMYDQGQLISFLCTTCFEHPALTSKMIDVAVKLL